MDRLVYLLLVVASRVLRHTVSNWEQNVRQSKASDDAPRAALFFLVIRSEQSR